MIYIIEIKREFDGMWYNSENSAPKGTLEEAINSICTVYNYQFVTFTCIGIDHFKAAFKE